MKILFLCVENAGRSQMAEAFARKAAPPGIEIFSAGSQPAPQIHPAVAEAMREIGIELGGCVPKGPESLPEGAFDLVVGMGCGDACPAARARKVITWDIPNPKGLPAGEVRKIRDQIELQVHRLLAGLRPVPMRRWPTVLSGISLFLGVGFVVSMSLLLSPVFGVPAPEKSLARVSGRTMQLREGLAGAPLWERGFIGFWDPALGSPEELDQLIQWHREVAHLAKDPEILHNLPGIMTRVGVLEGESGRRDQLEKRVQNWVEKGPSVIPLYGRLLQAAYFKESPPGHWPGLLEELLPPDWFRDRLEERLCLKTGQTERAGEIQEEERQAVGRLFGRYRLLTGVDLALLFLFGCAALFFLKPPLEFWRAGSAPLPPSWPAPAGTALLVRGCGIGVALSFALAFIPGIGSHPAGLLFSYLLWTLPVVWLFDRRLLRPNGLSLAKELGLSAPAQAGWKLAFLSLLGIGLDSLGNWLIGAAGSSLDLPNHWAEGFDNDLVFGSRGVVLSSLAGIVLIGPFFEELVFRGFLYGTLRVRLGPTAAGFASAGLFALVHGYGVVGFLSVLWSGVVFAWIYEKSGSLWPSVAAHGLGNFLYSVNVIAMLRLR